MCSYKVLFHKSSGYVVKCNSCSHYQVAYGTMVFTISTENMRLMFNQVSNLNAQKSHTQESRNERFQVKMPSDSVIMALNSRELKQYFNMLEEAFAMEELKQMLSENKIGKSS